MPQHDLDIDNDDGAAVRADINAALQALGSSMKGPSDPPAPIAGMVWVDDDAPSSTVWTIRMYDGTDWITLGTLDTTNNIYIPANIGWQVLSSTTLPNPTAAADIAIPAGFGRYRLEIDNLGLSASTQVYGRVSTDGGATFPTGSGDYSSAYVINNGASGINSGANNAAHMLLSTVAAASAVVTGQFEFTATGGFRALGNSFALNAASSAYEVGTFSVVRNSVSTPTHLRILPGTGTFTGGRLVLLGRT